MQLSWEDISISDEEEQTEYSQVEEENPTVNKTIRQLYSFINNKPFIDLIKASHSNLTSEHSEIVPTEKNVLLDSSRTIMIDIPSLFIYIVSYKKTDLSVKSLKKLIRKTFFDLNLVENFLFSISLEHIPFLLSLKLPLAISWNISPSSYFGTPYQLLEISYELFFNFLTKLTFIFSKPFLIFSSYKAKDFMDCVDTNNISYLSSCWVNSLIIKDFNLQKNNEMDERLIKENLVSTRNYNNFILKETVVLEKRLKLKTFRLNECYSLYNGLYASVYSVAEGFEFGFDEEDLAALSIVFNNENKGFMIIREGIEFLNCFIKELGESQRSNLKNNNNHNFYNLFKEYVKNARNKNDNKSFIFLDEILDLADSSLTDCESIGEDDKDNVIGKRNFKKLYPLALLDNSSPTNVLAKTKPSNLSNYSYNDFLSFLTFTPFHPSRLFSNSHFHTNFDQLAFKNLLVPETDEGFENTLASKLLERSNQKNFAYMEKYSSSLSGGKIVLRDIVVSPSSVPEPATQSSSKSSKKKGSKKFAKPKTEDLIKEKNEEKLRKGHLDDLKIQIKMLEGLENYSKKIKGLDSLISSITDPKVALTGQMKLLQWALEEAIELGDSPEATITTVSIAFDIFRRFRGSIYKTEQAVCILNALRSCHFEESARKVLEEFRGQLGGMKGFEGKAKKSAKIKKKKKKKKKK